MSQVPSTREYASLMQAIIEIVEPDENKQKELDTLELNYDILKAWVLQEYTGDTRQKIFARSKQISEHKDHLDDVLPLLEEPDSNKVFAGQGFLPTENIFWYGFWLQERTAFITSDKKVYLTGFECPSCSQKYVKNRKMCSCGRKGDKHYYCELSQKYNLLIDGHIGEIAPCISKQTVKDFLKGKTVTFTEVYESFRDEILYYMDFSGDDHIADVLACWCLATYVYELFYWFPNILFNAPSQSGKSKCANILVQLSFRGFDLGASAGVTPAQIFRTLDGNKGTLLADEFERNDKDPAQQLVNQIFNAGASKDAYVIRCEQINKSWVSKKFPIYCPKIVANISGLNSTSLSRFIAFKWLKTGEKEKSKRQPGTQKARSKFAELRNSAYLLMLAKWAEIKEAYENLDLPQTVINREADNWSPLFAIAKLAGGTAEAGLIKYLENYRSIEINSNDDTENFFQILLAQVSGKLPAYYTPKEIGTWQEIQDLFSYLKSPANRVGKLLASYKFQFTRGGGIRKYLISQEAVQKILNLYYGTEQTAHNTTNTTQQHKQHITPQKTGKNQENVPFVPLCVVTQKVKVLELLEKMAPACPSGVPFDALVSASGLSDDEVHSALTTLRTGGDVFECRPDYWRLT